MVSIMAYTGYDPPFPQGSPCASSAIDLTQVPIPTDGPPHILCTFVLAFANDVNGDGNFEPQWNIDHFTPENIAGVKAAIPTVNFAVSLGGANASWPGNSDPAWTRNAVRSITDIMHTYGLAGVDVDYENDLDDTFVPVMSSLMPQIQPAFWSLAPFTGTLASYLDLYDAAAEVVKPVINFQAYSMETEDSDAYVQQYTDITNDPRVTSHGGAVVGLGIDTNTADPRGMQYPAIADFYFSHMTNGLGTPNGLFDLAMVWSIEDSCRNGYVVEETLSGPPPSS